MEEKKIQTHDFDNAKNQLKQFSERIPSNVELQTVATHGGMFGWFEHDVTGREFNGLTSQIQSHLINTNNRLIDTIREFGQVYKALEALDKEYIQAILISIKASEEASKQAKESALKAEGNSQDILKSMEVQAQIIKVLEKFKKQIDEYKQLKNIDEIWNDCQTFKNDIITINTKIEDQDIEFKSELNKQVEGIKMILEENKINYEKQNRIILKRLKIAYFLASGAVSLTLIIFILHLLRII